MYNYLEVKKFKDQEVVKRMDVTGITDRAQVLIDGGLNRNLNHSEYFTFFRDSEEELPLI